MNRDETKKIIQVICASYPNYHPADLGMTVDIWNDMLQDFDYNTVALALKAYIRSDTSGFAPSVGQLVGKLQTIVQAESELSETEAWLLVSKALRNGYYGAEDEFNKLPDIIQKVVGSPTQLRNWSQTDMESIENVVQSNFMRSYRNVLNRRKEIERIPANVRTLLIGDNQLQFQIDEKKELEKLLVINN